MRVLIDGVSFQQQRNTGIGRIWTSFLNELTHIDGLRIFMLDRGGAPLIAGVELIEFPSYTASYTATDSLLLQRFCNKFDIDVFTSTGYTSVTTTPQVQMVYDMIPEVLGDETAGRSSKEKKLALSYASHFACISKRTRDDLLRFCPDIHPSRIAVTYCGVDSRIFNTDSSQGSGEFRDVYGQYKPYVLLVGSREQQGHYKNAKLLFDAIKVDDAADFDVICVGGERTINASWLRDLPSAVEVKRLDLSDAELAQAYAGALALVYPSLYEGFGMPVVEAMACRCPVITTHYGSLAEVAGGAALVISGHDPFELVQALERIRDADARKELIDAGLVQAEKFKWESSAKIVFELLLLARSELKDDQTRLFHRRWNELRTIQANVDIGID